MIDGEHNRSLNHWKHLIDIAEGHRVNSGYQINPQLYKKINFRMVLRNIF